MRKLLAFILVALTFACQTTKTKSNFDDLKDVKLNDETSTQLAIELAAVRGGTNIEYVAQLITKRNAWQEVTPSLVNRIETNNKYNQVQRFNLATIYTSSPLEANPTFVANLLHADDRFMNKLGWYIASAKPSAQVAQAVDNRLSELLTANNNSQFHEPMVAMAVSQNGLRSAYTLMRQSLMETGHEQFAQAMIKLRPQQASEDFLDYLAKAPSEELRQLTIKSVNLITCNLILSHMQNYPPSTQNPNFQHLFVFAVARNQGLSQLATDALEVEFAKNRRYIAALLARSPEWLQIAYVENVKHEMNAKQKLFLGDLKKTTPHEDVIYEIEATIR